MIVHGSVDAELASVTEEESEAALMAGGAERAEAVARLDPRERPKEGSVIRLGVDTDEVHLFDAESGVALR